MKDPLQTKLILKLNTLLEQTKRLYYENGKKDFDAGRVDGVKWALEIVLKSIDKAG